MNKPHTISDLARLGAAARWKGTTKEQRIAALKKAQKARKSSAKAARLAKSQNSP